MIHRIRIPFFFALSSILALGACGSDDPTDECEGDGCPCETFADCPDPLNQICDENFTCQPVDRGDTGTDADEDVGEDVGEDVVPDTPEEVGPDAVEDVPGDTPSDSDDVGEDGGEDASEDAPSDTGDVPADEGGDADVGIDADTGVDVPPDSDVEEDVVDPPPTVTNPWIAFIAPDALTLPKLYMVRATGSDLTQIDTGDLAMADPALSPDGTMLAYRRFGGATPVAKVVNLITGEVTEVTHTLNSMSSLGWSPDGTQLICEGNTESGAANDLYRIPLDGSGQVAIGVTPQGEGAPVWFAEDRIYFVSDPAGIFELYYRDPTDLGSPDVQVTFGAGIVGGASISWDEGMIAFVQRIGDAVQLQMQNLRTGGLTPIGSATASAPQITSDGVLVGYIDNVGESREIVLADLSGAVRHVVTSSSAAESEFDIGRVESSTIDLFWDPID